MDANRFDALTRTLGHGLTRRETVSALAALTGIDLVAGDQTQAKKRKQKHLQPDDTTGPCPPPPPPPGCSGATPNVCARLDTCEPACPAGKVYDAESCACVCSQPNTCCYCSCQVSAITRCFPEEIANENACRAACAAQCEEKPETVVFSFAGGAFSSATCDFANDRCNPSCAPEPMTCPAGVTPAICPSNLVCCLAEQGGGCCSVNAPVCCGAGCCGYGGVCCESRGCCSTQLPLCCGALCCLEGSSCCNDDEDCGAGKVCALLEGTNDGCCVDAFDRSLRSLGRDRAVMAPMALLVPKWGAAGDGNKRSRRNRRS